MVFCLRSLIGVRIPSRPTPASSIAYRYSPAPPPPAHFPFTQRNPERSCPILCQFQMNLSDSDVASTTPTSSLRPIQTESLGQLSQVVRAVILAASISLGVLAISGYLLVRWRRRRRARPR
ncbi:hypothetical protein MKEN_00303300 [Mycena kentingensis (nom. inval.)]|nr:hypothetical protein MKEN_00303300 [Mycena kentingensis (nom. inval.)]